MKDNVILLLSDARGVYIPRDFVRDFNFGEDGWQGVSTEAQDNLIDPYEQDYWEWWDSVLSNAYFVDKTDGKVYHLHQDGDLWAVCFEQMSDEEKLSFDWDL